MSSQHLEPAPDRLTDVPHEGIDPRFVFDFRSYDEPDDDHQRWSTWLSVEPLCRGPEPRPDWVVTSQAAVDTDLGVLKTGKEADVFLLERAVPDGPSVVMAAKRYRGQDHRDFHRSSSYTDGRKVRRSRDRRAIEKKTAHRPGGRRRPVGLGGVGVAQAALDARASRSPTRSRSTGPSCSWSGSLTTATPHRGWRRPARARPAGVVLRAGPRRPRGARPARHGARRPLAVQHPRRGRTAGRDRPARRSSTWSGTRPGMDFLLRDCTNVCTVVPRPRTGGRRARAVRRAAHPRALNSRTPGCLGCRGETQPRPGRRGRHPRRP